MPKLTTAFVKNVTKPGMYADCLNGLYLNVADGGTKSWIQRTTIHKKRRSMGLGPVRLVPLVQARQKAEDNMRDILGGGDPLADRRAADAIPTFEELGRVLLEEKLKTLKAPASRQQWTSTLEETFEVIGNIPVNKVTPQDVLKVVGPIWQTKHPKASKLLGRIEKVMGRAIALGHVTGTNPAQYKNHLETLLPDHTHEKDHHPAVAQKDMVRWWSLLQTRGGAGGDALRFTMMTAGRTSETLLMTWGELDMENGVWIIPKGRMKRNKAHTVVLNDYAMGILCNLKRGADSDLVFRKADGDGLGEAAMRQLMRKMHDTDLKAGNDGFIDEDNGRVAVPHGLRATFRTWCEEEQLDEQLAEVALSHSKGDDTAKAYKRAKLINPRRRMMTDWHRALEGKTTADVVELKA